MEGEKGTPGLAPASFIASIVLSTDERDPLKLRCQNFFFLITFLLYPQFSLPTYGCKPNVSLFSVEAHSCSL